MAKQREEQDHVGSVGLMRSRQMRQESAPDLDEVRNDWILMRSWWLLSWAVVER